MEEGNAKARRALRLVLSARLPGRSSLCSLLAPERDIADAIAEVIAERASTGTTGHATAPCLLSQTH